MPLCLHTAPQSRFHFSFAEWFDPSRMNYGSLRVMNDDLVQPKAGFGWVNLPPTIANTTIIL